MPYDPKRAPWDQNYAAPGAPPPPAPTSTPAATTPPATAAPAPTYDPKRAPWDQSYSAPPTPAAPTSTSTDPFIQDLQNSSLARLAAGVTQGFLLDPVEKAGELTGIGQNPPQWLEDRLAATREAADKGYAGVGGHVAGQLASPLFWLLPELRVPQSLGWLGSVGDVGAKLLTGGYRGAVGAAAQPTGATTPAEARKATIPQLETGGGVGAALGVPGALARGIGFENVQQPFRRIIRSLPLEFRRLEHLRELGIPSFTRWWHGHSLEPIGGRAPTVANREAMNSVGGQIRKALDDATTGMTFNATDPGVQRALTRTRGASTLNLATSGDALREYNRTLDRLWSGPLRLTGGRLNARQLQRLTSNLDARIRAIRPDTPDNVLLRRELENYRMTIFDNANAPPGQREAYARAREAWRRHATGRDSQPPGEPSGFIDPDHVARELSRRDPLRYPYGGGPRGGQPSRTQRAVNQAQEAIIRMSAAARRGAAGRPLRQPEDLAGQAGAVSQDQPLRFSWPSQ